MENVIRNINDMFGELTTITKENGIVLFKANDILRSLGYSESNWRTTLSRKCRCVSKCNVPHPQNNNKTIEMNFITEGDVYRLIASSKLPNADKFESWIFDEVLPIIRKTGGYVNNVDLMVNTYFSDVPDEQKGIVKGLLVNIEEKQKKIVALTTENDLLTQKNLEWADRPLINSLVRAYASSIGNDFAKAWNNFKKELLYKYSINLNSRVTNYLNTTGKKTKPKTLEMLDDSEIPCAISTIVSMCRENEVEIDDLLSNKAS